MPRYPPVRSYVLFLRVSGALDARDVHCSLEIASARARNTRADRSCLTHESSSLCSFQRSEEAGSRSVSIAISSESSLEVVPSKLSSTAGCINRVVLDLYRDDTPCDVSCANDRRNDRANILSSTLAINGRRTPGSIGIVCGRLKYVYAVALPATGEPTTCTP